MIMPAYPVTGIGMGNQWWESQVNDGVASAWFAINNLYLVVEAELGVPGHVVYLWKIISVFR